MASENWGEYLVEHISLTVAMFGDKNYKDHDNSKLRRSISMESERKRKFDLVCKTQSSYFNGENEV